ncbi:hypothetical protein [Priestia endophytica]|uniref:hypothetical protein n=1 Tax=Priestia endophytica TaxID=135735 RepID=UPI002280D039|nr:hypothetical protein [Priestia endophytica]MCY8232119.1 hypothetical protein [Priestia endophytica]
MEEQQNEKMSPKARWIIGGIVTICLAVLIVVAIQLNKKQEPEVATEATQDKKEKTADEQIGSDLEKALSELKKDKSSEDKKTDSKDKTTATKSSDPFAYLFNPSKSEDPLTFLSIDPTELPDVPEPVVSKKDAVAGVQDEGKSKGPVVTLPMDLNQTPLPDVDDPKLSDGSLDLGEDDNGTGEDITSKGDSETGQGNEGSGQGNEGSGQGNEGSGQGNEGSGQGNEGSGQGNEGSGQGNEGSGQGNEGSGQGDEDENPDKPLENVTLAIQEDTYERLAYYANQNREDDVLYYGNGETSKEEVVSLMQQMLNERYKNPKSETLVAQQLIQSLNRSQLNSKEAQLYNAELAKLQAEIKKVTREEYVDVYVIDGGDAKDQLYYAGTFADLINGNEQQLTEAKNSVMDEADKLASEAAANLANKLEESQREANKQKLINAINNYQLVANYSEEESKEADAKRSEALRTLSEITAIEEKQEIEYATKPKEDEENDEDKLKEFFEDLMEDQKYVQTLQQASAYVEKYPDLQDIIDEASEKLLDQSVEQMKSNSAYNDKYTKDHLAQSYAALTGLSTVPSEISEKAQDEFYGYRLAMQAEKLIDEDPTQAVIFAHEGYKRQETDGAKGVLQKANTALSEKAVAMDEGKAERAYELLTVTAKDVNEDIAQTATDRKTAYGYVAAGEKQYNAGETEEAIAYGSEANRLYPEKNLGGALVEKAAKHLLEEAGQKELTAQTETYNLIVNVKGLDESIKTQAESRKTVIDILDRVNTLEKQEQNVEEHTQQVFYYLDEAVGASENTGWSDEEKAKVQQRYDAQISSMLAQAQTWSTGSEEEQKKAAVYYKVIAEKGTHVGEETVANAEKALNDLGYE